jgi:hypothetical protein
VQHGSLIPNPTSKRLKNGADSATGLKLQPYRFTKSKKTTMRYNNEVKLIVVCKLKCKESLPLHSHAPLYYTVASIAQWSLGDQLLLEQIVLMGADANLSIICFHASFHGWKEQQDARSGHP